MSLSDEQIEVLRQQSKPKYVTAPKSHFRIKPPKYDPQHQYSEQQVKELIERDAKRTKRTGEEPNTTTYFGYPMLAEHSPRVMTRKILSHNQFKQFTAISNIGKSGAGKTTISQTLVHHLHTIAKEEYGIHFHVRWVGKEELIDLPKFLKSCAHVNTIFIFEDVSYAMDLVPKKQKTAIKEIFTHIRHELQDVRVICDFHYHYTRAFDKMMRDTYYTICASLGHEEKGNLLHIYGADDETKEMINKFEYRSRTQDEQGWFTTPLDPNDSEKYYIYWTQNPFQIALTNQHGKWHFMLYSSPKKIPELICHHCAPQAENFEPEKLASDHLIRVMEKRFGKGRAHLILRWYCFMMGGMDCLNIYDRKAWNWLLDFMQDYPPDMSTLIPKVGGTIRWGQYTRFRNIDKKDAENLKKEVLSKHKPYTIKRVTTAMESML